LTAIIKNNFDFIGNNNTHTIVPSKKLMVAIFDLNQIKEYNQILIRPDIMPLWHLKGNIS
jgi:hypothetical protein